MKNGTYTNQCNDKARKYLRISAGPQRGRYVHDLILEAKLGRKLTPGETAEHKNGNGLDVDPDNISGPIFRQENTKLMCQRLKRESREQAKRWNQFAKKVMDAATNGKVDKKVCRKLQQKAEDGNTCLQTPGTCESCPLWWQLGQLQKKSL
jgi:hypothetical protein